MPPDPTKPSLRTIPSQRLGFPAHHPPALPCLPLHPSTCWHPSSLCTPSCPLLNDHHPCTLTPERVTAHPKKLAQHHPNHSRQVPPQIHVRREGVRRCWLGERNGRKLLQLGPPQNKVIFNLDHFSVFKVSWFKPNLFCWGQKATHCPAQSLRTRAGVSMLLLLLSLKSLKSSAECCARLVIPLTSFTDTTVINLMFAVG